MKLLTVLGTRPEIIRLSRTIEKLDGLCEHKLLHTGQNFDPNLSDVFFRELGLRPPDYYLGVNSQTFGQQIGQILTAADKVLLQERPDALLILGDTNSGLCSILAKRMGITVYHMEAGNRCYDDRVPEEVNRRIIDHCSDILMPYTYRSKENLLREGIDRQRIFVIGNPIYEVLNHYSTQIDKSGALFFLGLQNKRYFLVTMHRAENVDIEERLRNLVEALELLAENYKLPIICSLHPHTKTKMEKFGLCVEHEYVRYLTPFGFFDFVALEKNALCVLSDSGTVQEECCILNVPCVTIRDVTERPETLECGSNVISGVNPKMIVSCVDLVLSQSIKWIPPKEYVEGNVSTKVLRIICGYKNSIETQ